MKEKLTKVLIIDDDPDVRIVMNLFLKKQGYDVETASRKEEAFEKLEQFQPSVVLLDVLLSGTDGRNICREIREKENLKNVPIIMVSAHPGASDNIGNYGADDFISKPINTDSLLEKVNKLTKKAR